MGRIEVHSFADDEAPARRLADRLGAPYAVCGLHAFPDGETLPKAPARRLDTLLFYASLDRPNAKLAPLLLAADAYERLGVSRLVLIAPYLCYLRQDKVFHPGESLSRDVIGRVLGQTFDRIVTVQAHAHRTRDLSGIFHVPVDNLPIAADLAALFDDDAPGLVVGPDGESLNAAQAAAGELRAEAACFHKVRKSDRQVTLRLPHSVPVAGQAVLIVDDVCSTGATILEAVRQLSERGAAVIDVAVAHALFGAPTTDALTKAGVRRVVSSDSVSHPSNGLALSGVLAEALKDEFQS